MKWAHFNSKLLNEHFNHDMSKSVKISTYIYFRRDPNDGSYLIDRTPAYFEPILNFLRTGSLIINPNLNAEGINNKINKAVFKALALLMLD